MEKQNLIIAMVQGGNLILFQPNFGGKQTLLVLNDMVYAAELAEAINNVAMESKPHDP